MVDVREGLPQLDCPLLEVLLYYILDRWSGHVQTNTEKATTGRTKGKAIRSR